MSVALREKKVGKGQVSSYLDIYHNRKRWYEFLDIRISKNKPTAADKEKRRMANEIKARRDAELISQDNGITDRGKRKADFVQWYENFIKEKNYNSTRASSALWNLKNYLGNQPLTFNSVTPEWIKGFTKYLTGRMHNNTARHYLSDFFTAMEEAVRQDIISVNPFRKLQKKDRLKKQDSFRHAYTLKELQHLADTPAKIHPQIRQGFFLSCFCGLRWSDIQPLKWTEITQKEIEGRQVYYIYFDQQKTKRIEYLPLSRQAAEILQERRAEAKEMVENSPYVFPFLNLPDKTKSNRKQWQIANYSLKKWANAAGFDPKLMHFHVARHTFATNVLENSPDGDLYTVSKLLGHTSIQPTQIYAHVRDKRKYEAVKSLPGLRFSNQKINLQEIKSMKDQEENARRPMVQNVPVDNGAGKFKSLHNIDTSAA